MTLCAQCVSNAIRKKASGCSGPVKLRGMETTTWIAPSVSRLSTSGRKMKLRPPVKIHGGKYYLSEWIIQHFPENYTELDFLEAYTGGGSVLINKAKSRMEVLNDIEEDLIQIYRALRDEPGMFIGRLKRVKYCESTFDRALKKQDGKWGDYMDQAVNEFILRRMSRGGMKKSFAWSDRTRGGQPGDVNAWNTIIKMLPLIAERLAHVHILNQPALETLKVFNNDDALVYVDPPYLPDARTANDIYAYEMSTEDHIKLSNILNSFNGKVVLSGYPSKLYRRLYEGWKCVKKKVANHSSQTKKKARRTEAIWMNY